MKKGAKAVFIEPLGENVVLNFVRDFIERRIRGVRTEDEHPLLYKDIERLMPYFKEVKHTEFQLLGMMERVIGSNRAKFLRLDAIDGWLLDKLPLLKRFCRLVVICLTK